MSTVFSEQVPPSNLEAEQSVLGAMLMSREAVIAVRMTIATPEDLYSDKHQVIYRAIVSLFDQGRPVDLVTVSEALDKPMQEGRSDTWLQYTGGQSYLATLVNLTPTAANAGEYARIVARKATLRRLIQAGYATVDIARKADREIEDSDQVVAQARADAEAELRKVATPGQKGGLESIESIYEWAAERLDSMGTPDPNRIQFGLKEFDEFAWLRGEVVAIHAPTGNGKTRLLQALIKGAAKQGQAAGHFSLEMGRNQTLLGMIAAEGHLHVNRLRNMDREPLRTDERERFLAAAERLKQLPIHIDYTPAQRFAEMRSKVLSAAMKLGDLAVFAIDYAAITGDQPSSWQRHEQLLIQIHYEAQWLAREINALAIILDQAPTDMLQRQNPTPTINDFRDAKGIPQAVDHAVGLLIPGNCSQTGAGKRAVIPTIPVPKGDPMLYSDERWQNVLMAVYTKGRFTGPGFLMPLYHEGYSGYVGNLLQYPWDASPEEPGCPGEDAVTEKRPRLKQQRFDPVDSF